MRKMIAVTTLIIFGTVAPWSLASAQAVEPAAAATAGNANTERQARQDWFSQAVGDILSGDDQPHGSAGHPAKN